jgi:hypothetical protein
MIWDLISGLLPNVWGYLAAAGAALLGLGGVYLKGRSDAKAKADLRDLKEDMKAHERINEANLGIGASDAERVERLREFAAKHGDR